MGRLQSSEFSQKWAVAAFFNELPDGLEFSWDEAPLHATLAGVFAISFPGVEIAGLLEKCVDYFERFTVTGGPTEQWGSIKVTTLNYSEKFEELYLAVQNTMSRHGAVFNEPQYLRAGFKPHVTQQKAGRLESGHSKDIASVSLVDMFPGSDAYRRRILKTIKLKSNLI